MATPEDWDYGEVPPRSWTWYVPLDPHLRCPAEKTVELGRNGLSWTGDCHHPNWGGGYTIGSQTFEQFLRDGPLNEQMPATVEAELRAHLLAHRRPGPRAELCLSARVTAPGSVLERVDCALDDVHLTTIRPDEPTAAEHVFFTGAVAPGEHALRAAFVLRGGRPALAYANDVALRVDAGQRLTARFQIGPGGVVAVNTAST